MAEVSAMPFDCGEIAWMPAYDVQVSSPNDVVDLANTKTAS